MPKVLHHVLLLEWMHFPFFSSSYLHMFFKLLLLCCRRIRKAVVDDDSDDDDGGDTKPTCSSSASVQSTKRDLQAKVSQLETMFPNIPRSLLEEALNFSNGDYEGAVDHIMQQQAAINTGLLLMFFTHKWLFDGNVYDASIVSFLVDNQ